MPSLRELRRAEGKTIRQVARDLDMSERQISRIERGETQLRHVVAVALASYYGVPVDSINPSSVEAAA